MKSLQDKICDSLTLAGLLGVIGFGSASLLPETEDKPKESAPVIEKTDSTDMPLDTISEVHETRKADRIEENMDSLAGDSIDVLPEESVDTAFSHTELHSNAEENATSIHSNKQNQEHLERESKTEEGKDKGQENLME